MKGRTPVFAEPAKNKPKLIIVGEGPGKKEISLLRPFVGLSGALLNEILKEAGIDRADCHVTNGTLCKPESDAEAEAGAACCAPRLLQELASIDAPILALGKDPTRTILGVNSIILSRGFIWRAKPLDDKLKVARAAVRRAEKLGKEDRIRAVQDNLRTLELRHALAGRLVLPTIHPAFVLRSDAWRPIFALDVHRVSRWVHGELTDADLADNIRLADSIDDLAGNENTYIVLDKPEDIHRACALLSSTVASDIETDGLNPLTANIDCVCLSDGKRTVVISPWQPSVHAELYSRILSQRTVVFHNGYNFDHIALRRDGVLFGNVEDTLLAHHAFASHLPQKLDQLASTFTDSGPWKMENGMRGGNEEKGSPMQRMSTAQRDKYNAIDGVITFRVWEALQPDLEPERAVYNQDKALAQLCQGMQIAGIGVDMRKRQELYDELQSKAKKLLADMRKLVADESFSPARPRDVRGALFDTLGAPVLGRTKTGLPDTSEATLEAFAKQETPLGEFSRALMTWRLCTKIGSTYVQNIPVLSDERAHYNWKSFGTVSGRLASRMQSNPRYGSLPEQKPRELYVPDRVGLDCRLVAQIHDAAIFEVGGQFVYFDLSQAEARMAAYLSGDPNLMEAVKEDIHTANALVAFGGIPEAFDRLMRANEKSAILGPDGKPLKWKAVSKKLGGCKEERDISKNAGFAIWYQGAPDVMYEYLYKKGFPVSLRACQAMHQRFHDRYYRYYAYADRLLASVRQCGYLRTPVLGRFCWLGYFPKPTEVVNRPIQSGIADVMNERLMQIEEKCRGMTKPEDVEEVICEAWSKPVYLKKSQVVDADREFVLPIDLKRGENWGSLG